MASMETNKSFAHLLCGVDGSDPACRAAADAARLVLALGAKLTFLAVAQEAERSEEIEQYLEVEGLRGLSLPMLPTAAEACLDTAMSIAREVGVANATRLVMTGEVAPTICLTAQTKGADCIVLGRHRRGAARTLVKGSVAKAVGDNCDAALVLVG